MATNLPKVKQEIFNSLSAQLSSSSEEVARWIALMSIENPNITAAVDAMGIAGSMSVAALVYKLLHSQAEADELNED